MITVTLDHANKLADDLDRLAKRSVPYATRNALNTTVFEARRLWNESIEKQMVLRNKFTTRSTKVVKAKGLTIDTMEAVVGTPLDYMKTQEDGGTITKGGKYGVKIPTTSAAGQAKKARPRTRQVQGKNLLSAIHLANRVSGSRSRRNAVAIAMAIKSGSRVAFLDLRRRKGLFRIPGDARRPRVRMIWDLSRPSVKVPKNPTLMPVIEQLTPRMPTIFTDAVIEQLRRAKVAGY